MTDTNDDRYSVAIALVRRELARAVLKHTTPMRSAHEGYAILKEEVDEMWDEIKANRLHPARAEAIQVAAMALRFLVDINPEENPCL